MVVGFGLFFVEPECVLDFFFCALDVEVVVIGVGAVDFGGDVGGEIVDDGLAEGGFGIGEFLHGGDDVGGVVEVYGGGYIGDEGAAIGGAACGFGVGAGVVDVADFEAVIGEVKF